MPRMKPAGKKLVTAWSFSSEKQWQECEARWYYGKVLKLPEGAKGHALVRGSEIHTEAEVYLKTNRGEVPHSLQLFTEEFVDLRKRQAASEAQWAFRRDWTPCEWFAKDTWLRVMLDTYYTFEFEGDEAAKVIDFKTGKIREGYGEQLELYALSSFKKFPDVRFVIPELWFIDEGQIVGGTERTMDMPDVQPIYERGRDEAKLQKKWEKRGDALVEFAEKCMADDFEPTPTPDNWRCKWCPYSQQHSNLNNPPCPH